MDGGRAGAQTRAASRFETVYDGALTLTLVKVLRNDVASAGAFSLTCLELYCSVKSTLFLQAWTEPTVFDGTPSDNTKERSP